MSVVRSHLPLLISALSLRQGFFFTYAGAFLPMELTSRQRKFLEKCAHDINPTVLVGGGGLTEEQIAHINAMLESHELIKIKFNEFKDEKAELAEKAASLNNAVLVRIIGNIAILFRQAKEPEKRKFIK